MTSEQIEQWRIAQKLDDVMQYSQGTKMVSDAQWVDIVATIREECPKAYAALVDRFEEEWADTKPCVYCDGGDHRVVDCLTAQAHAKAERVKRDQEEAAELWCDERHERRRAL